MIIIFLLLHMSDSFKLVPNHGEFLNGHYLYTVTHKNICETRKDISFTIDVKETNDLLEKITAISKKFSQQVTEMITEFRTTTGYKVVDGKRFFVTNTTQTYQKAVLTCRDKKGTIIEANNDNINNTIALTNKTQTQNIWQSISDDRNDLFTLSHNLLPLKHSGKNVTINLEDINDISQCAIFETNELKFSTIPCTNTALTICQAIIQPSDLSSLTILNSNLKTALSDFKHQVFNLKKQINSLPKTVIEGNQTKYNLFDPTVLEMAKGLTVLSDEEMKSNISPFYQFVRSQTHKLNGFRSSLSQQSINIFSIVTECDHVFKENDVKDENKVISFVGKNGSKVLFQINQFNNCTDYPVIRSIPFTKDKGLEGDIIFLPDKCVDIPQNATFKFSAKSELTNNSCCTSLFNTTKNICPEIKNFSSFYFQKNDTIYFSSSTPINLEGSCAPEDNVMRGILTPDSTCSISKVPFFNDSLTLNANFQSFSRDGSPVQESKITKTAHPKLPTWVVLLMSISSSITVLTSIILLCLYICKKTRRQHRQTTSEERTNGTGNIILTSILKSPKCRHNREVYTKPPKRHHRREVYFSDSDKTTSDSSDSEN